MVNTHNGLIINGLFSKWSTRRCVCIKQKMQYNTIYHIYICTGYICFICLAICLRHAAHFDEIQQRQQQIHLHTFKHMNHLDAIPREKEKQNTHLNIHNAIEFINTTLALALFTLQRKKIPLHNNIIFILIWFSMKNNFKKLTLHEKRQQQRTNEKKFK